METNCYKEAEKQYFVSLFRKMWYLKARVCELGCDDEIILNNQYVDRKTYLGVCKDKEKVDLLKKKNPTMEFRLDHPDTFFTETIKPNDFDIYINLDGKLNYRESFFLKMKSIVTNGEIAMLRVPRIKNINRIVSLLSPLRVILLPHKKAPLLKIALIDIRLTKLIYLYNKIHANLGNCDCVILIIHK